MLSTITKQRPTIDWNAQFSSPVSPVETSAWDQMLTQSERHYGFELEALRGQIAVLQLEREHLTQRWQHLNSAAAFTVKPFQFSSALGSLFFLLLAIWIFQIGQSEAPYWWVPYLSLFFVFAAFAALRDCLTQTSQRRKAQLRNQIRANSDRLQQLQYRHLMLCGTPL